MSIITRSQGAVIDAKQRGAKGDGVTDDSKVTSEKIHNYSCIAMLRLCN